MTKKELLNIKKRISKGLSIQFELIGETIIQNIECIKYLLKSNKYVYNPYKNQYEKSILEELL